MKTTSTRNRVFVCLVVAALGLSGCDTSILGVMALGPASPACETPQNSGQLAERVLQLINAERELRGMKPLLMNDGLNSAAAAYACTMIEDGFFGHDNPLTGETFSDRHTAGSHRCYPAGENLALGQDSAEQVVEAWMNSQTHRDNILTDAYREMGLAVRQDSVDGPLYWVQMFIGARVEGCEDSSASDDESDLPRNDLLSDLDDTPTMPSDRTHVPLTGELFTPGWVGPPADE